MSTNVILTFLHGFLMNQFIAGGILMQVWVSVQALISSIMQYFWSKLKKMCIDRIYYTITINASDVLADRIQSYCLLFQENSANLVAITNNADNKVYFSSSPASSAELSFKSSNGKTYTIWVDNCKSNSSGYGINNHSINLNPSRNDIVLSTIHVGWPSWSNINKMWSSITKPFYASAKEPCIDSNVLTEFLVHVNQECCNNNERRSSVYKATRDYGRMDLLNIRLRPLSSVILPKGKVTTIVNSIDNFLDGQEWYAIHGVPHRFGLLLEGMPGTGKTSLAHALAGRWNLPIYCISNLSELQNDHMTQRVNKCIILLEDIDCMTQSRQIINTNYYAHDVDELEINVSETIQEKKQKQKQKDMNFSILLNYIDGVASPEGRILIMTTNHKELLDPALIRPGRINMEVNFSYADVNQIARLINRFYCCDMDYLTDHINDVEHIDMTEDDLAKAELFMEKLNGKHITMSGVTNHFMNNRASFELALAADFEL